MDWFLHDKGLHRERFKLNGDTEKLFLGSQMLGTNIARAFSKENWV